MWSGFLSRLTGARFVEPGKITAYLLDPEHPKGGPKARFFLRFGFELATPWLLEDALCAHPDINDIVDVSPTAFGTRSVIECHVATPDGRNPCIRSVWILDHGADRHRLVTAYPTG